MKIGVFTNAYKPIISGVVNSIDLIKKGLRLLGHRVYIFAPGFSGYRDKEAGVFRFMSVNLTTRMQFPLAIPFSPRIFRIIQRVGLDLVHCHHPFLMGELGAKFAKKLNIPLVFTFHTQYEQYSHYIPLPQDLVKRVTRASVLRFTEKCDMIICPSRIILSLLDDYGVTSPVELLPNAIDLEQFKNPKPGRVKEKYGIKDEEKLLIYVGRIGLEKNLGFMLKAFKNALYQVPEAKLMIVGEGQELEPLKDQAEKLNISNRVVFTGRIEYRDISDYYAAGYAFIMTSTTEVKPLAILEAMASNLPVVAIAAPGSSDTVNHDFDGILTDRNLENYTGELIRILKDEDLRNRLSKGARKTSEEYSIINKAKKLEELYQKLIRERKSS